VREGVRTCTITRRIRMPAKTRRKKSSSRSDGSRRGAERSGGTRTGRKKSGSPGTSGATKTLKKTAVKVMAGAAAGAVRAVIPPLEEAAGTSERAAGITPGSGSERAKSGQGRKSGT
jgi:hypothetical protein